MHHISPIRVLAAAAALLVLAGTAAAQNVLLNPGFELNPPATPGNHVGHPITPWNLGPGPQTNVVQVDGPGGFNYGNDGPESDASAPGAGIAQHYLDIVGDANLLWQTFTPRCSGAIEFGGAFSTRDDSPGHGSITIHQGNGSGGTALATIPVSVAGGQSATNPWTKVGSTVALAANTVYSFVVVMDDELNLDDAYVRYVTACEPPDPCCPPFNSAVLKEMLTYQGSGSINAPYTLEFQPATAFSSQMQAYINYLNVVNPAIQQITIHFRMHDAGTGTNPVLGPMIGNDHWVTWQAGALPAMSPLPFTPFFQSPPETLLVNTWYVIHTGMYLEGGQHFFPDSCAVNEIAVRVQVQGFPLKAVKVLQVRTASGAILERPLVQRPN
jgi:hypothetical protein